MAAESDSCCTCCLSFMITMGLMAVFLWLSLRVDEPKCYLDHIYLPALNKSLNSPQNSTLFFTLKLANPNKDKGIRYDAIQLAFAVFVASNATRPVANATVEGFYQGHQKKARKPGSSVAGVNLTVAAVNGKVYYRVNFTTSAKYKILLWYTKRHRLWGGANVEINNSGEKVYGKAIRLGNEPTVIESGASMLRGGYRALVPFFVAVLFVLNGHGFN